MRFGDLGPGQEAADTRRERLPRGATVCSCAGLWVAGDLRQVGNGKGAGIPGRAAFWSAQSSAALDGSARGGVEHALRAVGAPRSRDSLWSARASAPLLVG